MLFGSQQLDRAFKAAPGLEEIISLRSLVMFVNLQVRPGEVWADLFSMEIPTRKRERGISGGLSGLSFNR